MPVESSCVHCGSTRRYPPWLAAQPEGSQNDEDVQQGPNREVGACWERVAMIERVQQALAAWRPAVRGQTLGAACSGGADSTALLLALADLRNELGFELRIVHLNHRLRGPASDADEAFVGELAASLDLTLHLRRVDVATMANEQGLGLEEAGRQARYAYFEELICAGACDRIATGHTLSDQAETLIFRLARGSGVRGLAGIHPERGPGIIRPLLDVNAEEVRRYLRARGAAWREDATNQDRAFRRNRIRLDIAPQLLDLNPRWEQALGRTAKQALDEEAYWDTIVSEASARLCKRRNDGLRIAIAAFTAEHVALQRRLLRWAYAEIAGPRQASWDHIEALRALFEPGLGTGRVTLPDLVGRRSMDAVLLSPPALDPTARDWAVAVDPPVEIALPDGRSKIRVDIPSQHIAGGRYTEPTWSGLDCHQLLETLVLRPWRPGDRWRNAATGRVKKLQEMLQEARIEVWDRSQWPVLASGDEVVWTRGFGVSAQRRADGGASKNLTIQETDGEGREIRGIQSWLESVYKV